MWRECIADPVEDFGGDRTGLLSLSFPIKCRVAQDFPKRENIPSIHQVVYRKRMPAEMCMQSLHTGHLGQSREKQFHCVNQNRSR